MENSNEDIFFTRREADRLLATRIRRADDVMGNIVTKHIGKAFLTRQELRCYAISIMWYDGSPSSFHNKTAFERRFPLIKVI